MIDKTYNDLSYKIIGIAMEIHKTLGPGFLENTYQKAYEAELKSQKIPFQFQKRVKIFYKDNELGFQVLDLVVDDKIIVELKSVSQLLPVHKYQLLSYLKATKYELGLLINFAEKSLACKRVILSA